MRVGFAKNDITPRVGVELYGFGPFLCRHSIGIRDRLWARAMVVEHQGKRMVLVTCDLVGVERFITERVRRIVAEHTDVPEDAVAIVCSHTHSGPNTGRVNFGWGEVDAPYVETLPSRIAKACVVAWENAQQCPEGSVEWAHAEVPCEGVGLNREYDKDAPPLDEVLRDDWRPAKPELTDTTCHVITVKVAGRLAGFASYFGCHGVVCCDDSRYFHGDYCGVATNLLEREHPGSVGLFLQGAEGDVNSCVVHKAEQESLLALDVIAARYAKAVRTGMTEAKPFNADEIAYCRQEKSFTRKEYSLDQLRAMLPEHESRLQALDAHDGPGQEGRELRMDAVWTLALRHLIAKAEAGQPLDNPAEICGMRIGPISILGSGFETFQAIKNDVVARAAGPITLVTSVTNDSTGYAPDRTTAARGGYAAHLVPFMSGTVPYANVHEELVDALLALDAALR